MCLLAYRPIQIRARHCPSRWLINEPCTPCTVASTTDRRRHRTARKPSPINFIGSERRKWKRPLLRNLYILWWNHSIDFDFNKSIDWKPPADYECSLKQARDQHYNITMLQVRLQKWVFHLNQRGLFVKKPFVVDMLQATVHKLSRKWILYLSRRLQIVGPPKRERSFDTLLRMKHWMHSARDVFVSRTEGASCVKNGIRYHNKRDLDLFLASARSRFPARDILHPLQKTMQGNRYFPVMTVTDRYLDLYEWL